MPLIPASWVASCWWRGRRAGCCFQPPSALHAVYGTEGSSRLVPPERPERCADKRGGDSGDLTQPLPGALVAEHAVLGGDLGGMLKRPRRPLHQQSQLGTGA